MARKQEDALLWFSVFCCLLPCACFPAAAQCNRKPDSAEAPAQLAIIDTDIGDDIDDAFAVALAIKSPELTILGVTVTYGNTPIRARLADRFLRESGCPDIPVAVGRQTPEPMNPSQMNYALHEKDSLHPMAIDFLSKEIKANPDAITLIAIGPLINLGDLIEKDPETFRKLKRVVLMGGSIARRNSEVAGQLSNDPIGEHNIVEDIPGAQKLFASGVPIYMMPLDSTHDLKLDEVKRRAIFGFGTPMTDQLTLLYAQWNAYARFGQTTPTLFDAMAVAYAIKPELCPTDALNITVDEKGQTLRAPGATNAFVCLHSDPNLFFPFLVSRLLSAEK